MGSHDDQIAAGLLGLFQDLIHRLSSFDDNIVCGKIEGDGIRPGCLADATDRNQIQELIHLGELTERAWDAGVQVIIEGPGHMPMDQIEANVMLQKKICKRAYIISPFS